MAKECGADRLMIYGDSNLVVQQTMKECDATTENMIAYRNLYNIMEGSFDGCELRHIGRASNEEADTLANIGSLKLKVPPGVFLEKINKRFIKVAQPAAPSTPATGTAAASKDAPPVAEPSVEVFLVEPIWTKPFLAYMLRQELPEDTVEARRITRRAKAFTIIGHAPRDPRWHVWASC